MEDLLQYLIKSAAILSMFYVCFKRLLSKETYFTAKRIYLFLGLLASVLLPFVVITHYVSMDLTLLSRYTNPTAVDASSVYSSPNNSWESTLMQVYFIGVLLMLLRLIYQMVCVAQVITRGKRHRQEGYIHVRVAQSVLPFSFFKYIVYNPKLHASKDLTTILIHEKAHCRQWHSIDTLVVQFILLLQWFNPLAWLYQKEVAQNLEYVADEASLDKMQSKKNYQYVLLNLALGKQKLAITSPFYNSLIKNRILMLNKKKSTLKSHWKLFPMIPLSLLFVFLFNTQTIAQLKTPKSVQKTNVIVAEVNKNSSDASLEEMVQLFKKRGVELEFKRVKRNSKGEITDINATYSRGSGSNGAHAISGNEPIEPFRLRLEYEGDKVIRLDFRGIPSPPVPPAPPAQISKRISTHTWTGNTNGTTKVKVIHKADTISKHSKIIHLGENSWFEIHDTDANLFEVEIEDFGISQMSDSLLINLPSEEQIWGVMDSLDSQSYHANRRLKIINSGPKWKGNQVFIFDTDEAPAPIIIKDGVEIERLDNLSEDEIKCLSLLKGKEAIEKYGAKGAHGVIEIKSKKE